MGHLAIPQLTRCALDAGDGHLPQRAVECFGIRLAVDADSNCEHPARRYIGGAQASALARWRSLGPWIDQEIANLKAGQKGGYSATQATVKGTIEQLDGYVDAAAEKSGYLAALVFSIVTADVDPDTLYDVAVKQVEKERALALELGRKVFGDKATDWATLASLIRADPANRFKSREEVAEYTQRVYERAYASAGKVVLTPPTGQVKLEPFPNYQQATAPGGQYLPRADDGSRCAPPERAPQSIATISGLPGMVFAYPPARSGRAPPSVAWFPTPDSIRLHSKTGCYRSTRCAPRCSDGFSSSRPRTT